ncbi:hypothetical protein RhoFasGS6_02692 [Rhodococcus fascians]|nr:hypothetical protein [Rhodococcus fascians]
MAVALGCSATVAEAYVSVGVALHTRLPLVKKAFEAGEIDLPRVRVVCRILDNLSDDIVKSVEDEIVEAARRSSPGPLEKEIWDILLRVAPEEAAALREFAKKFRNVSYAPAGELARIRAELTAPEAAAAWQLLEEMADTLCRQTHAENRTGCVTPSWRGCTVNPGWYACVNERTARRKMQSCRIVGCR